MGQKRLGLGGSSGVAWYPRQREIKGEFVVKCIELERPVGQPSQGVQ
jgi:hypothetical protein